MSRLLVLLACAGCSLTGALSSSTPSSPTATPSPSPPSSSSPSPPSPSPSPTARPAVGGARDATPEQWKVFKDLVAKHQEVLLRLAQRAASEPYPGIPLDGAKAAAALEALRPRIDAFGELREAACGTYRDLALMDLRPHEEPRWICEHAAEVGGLIAEIARVRIAELARVESGSANGPIETLRTGYPVTDRALDELSPAKLAERRARAVAALQPLVPFVGEPVDLEAMIPNRAAELRDAVAAAPAAGDRFKYTHRSPAAVAKVASDLFARVKYHGARPTTIAVLARGTDWAVARAASGVPVRRTHRVQVVIRAADEAFCRMYEVDVGEAYMGGGRWGRPSTAGVETGPRVVSCGKP